MKLILKKLMLLVMTAVLGAGMCFADMGISKVYAEEEEPVDFEAIKIYYNDQLMGTLKLSDLEAITGEEGNLKYTYSSYNRNVSLKNDLLEDIEGPTIKGILGAVGVDVDALPDTAVIRCMAYDGWVSSHFKSELFGTRYYFPNGADDSYMFGGAAIDGSYEGKVEVKPILMLDPDEMTGRLVFGQAYPNEQTYPSFTDCMVDYNKKERASEIRISTSSPGTWKTTSGMSVRSGNTVNVGTQISISVSDMNTSKEAPFYWINYTTDGKMPNMGSHLYNYDKWGNKNPVVITKPGKTTVKVRVNGYGKYSSKVLTYTYSGRVGVPAGFTAARAGYDSTILKWKGNKYMSGYKVYQKRGKRYVQIARIARPEEAPDIYSYTHKNLKTGTRYYYKIRAYMTIGGKDINSSYSAARSARPTLARPVIEDIYSPEGKSSVELQWSEIDGANGYVLYRSLKKTRSFKSVRKFKPEEVTYINERLKTGRTYYYKVRAYRMVGGKAKYSSYSPVKGIKVK